MKVLITGVQNVVEESVVKIAIDRISGKSKFKILSFSDFVNTGETPSGEIKLLKNTQKKVKDAIQMKLLKSRPSDHIIVDGYFTVRSKIGFFPVITRALIDSFKPDVIVNIEVDPLALEGKLKDPDEFVLHQQVEKYLALSFGAYAGSGIKLLRTGIDGAREAGDELYQTLKDVVSK
jgi:adenylate kinase